MGNNYVCCSPKYCSCFGIDVGIFSFLAADGVHVKVQRNGTKIERGIVYLLRIYISDFKQHMTKKKVMS